MTFVWNIFANFEQTFKHFIINELPLLSEFCWWGNYFYFEWLPVVGTYNYTDFSILLQKRQPTYAYSSASEE